MAPLIVLLCVTGVLLVRSRWTFALRTGLAAMFALTGVAHFVGMRTDLVAMVPPGLPAPELLVTVTGIIELVGAAALLWARSAPWAAGVLGVLLVVMFPANVHRALIGTPSFTQQLLPRTALQVLFLACVVAVLIAHIRQATTRENMGPGVHDDK